MGGDVLGNQINWRVSRRDHALIRRIVVRAIASPSLGLSTKDTQDVEMDLIAVHANIHPLRLEELAEADFFNFAHDIAGIRRHLNRETCELENQFWPRFMTAVVRG